MGVKKTKAGFEATVYDVTAKTYLALLLNSISSEELLGKLDEAAASQLIADIMKVIR